MRPGRKLLIVTGVWALLALLLVAIRHGSDFAHNEVLLLVWWGLGFVVLLVAIADYFASHKIKLLEVDRELPASFSLGSSHIVTLHINNPFKRGLHLSVFDDFPDHVKVDAFPFHVVIPANAFTEIQYSAKPIVRGDAEFGQTNLKILTRLQLWEIHVKRSESSVIRIYPNFKNINMLSMLHHGQQINQMGIHIQQRRGEGSDFHQLKEYSQGDSLSKIDWKATARHVKLISRDYQDERDQDIVFLLDCGRRMRSIDGELSHFDHALNALLLTAYIALKQGDAVGVQSFAGESRWIPPVKGASAINRLLNNVYDLHSSSNSSDLLQAAEELIVRHRKRSLVIIISNLRDEDHDDLIAATSTLSKHHLVMVASLREEFLDSVVTEPVQNFDMALRYSGVFQFLEQRKRLIETLSRRGIIITDSLAHQLHSVMANQYLKLKRSGRV